MLLQRLMIITMIFLPLPALSDYDAEKLKQGISDNQEMFKVTGWIKSEDQQNWIAKTQLKRVKISVGAQNATFISPYINPRQIKSAKILCAEFAALAMTPKNEDELNSIKTTIKKSTTRHQIKFISLNGVNFTVLPKLIGPVVSLHCSVKSL